jgi:tRNA dimethylallyltransferase
MPFESLPPNALPLLFLLGPTAVGKSALAMELAERFGAAILSMDAMQLYRGADIGTGKATAQERTQVPHGGLDLAEPGISLSVADYMRHAADFIALCRSQGKPVIAAGGTGLYYRALTRGLCEAPATPDELRRELDALPLEALLARLQRVDPAMATPCIGAERGDSQAAHGIDLQNPRRISRAIAVMESTGISLAEWQRRTPPPIVPAGTYATCLLVRDLPDLRARIARRVPDMVAAGWVNEVRGLIARHGAVALQRFQAIGYPEIAAWCAENTLGSYPSSPLHLLPSELVDKIVMDTQHYAKRQLTWFKKELIVRQVNLSHSPILNLQEWWT